MPKPSLMPEMSQLESDVIETLLAGHHAWRSDLAYPESHSDMQGAVRALLSKYEVKLRDLPMRLASPCPECSGLGHVVEFKEPNGRAQVTCPEAVKKKCDHGRVYYDYEATKDHSRAT